MNYREKEILRVKNEDLYNAVKSMEYYHNELRDYLTQIKNVSMLVAEEKKTYEEAVEICYPDLESYEKVYITNLTKDYDAICGVLGNYVPVVNSDGLYEINLA